MPELETTIRAAAPRPSRAPAHLEWAIWTTLAGTAPLGDPLLADPELIVDEPTTHRQPSRFRPLIGIAAVAAVLLAAVVIAGLRDRAAHPAAGHRTAPPAAAPKAGTYYVESTCPDEGRGACFDPFPAGRYSFHKTDPQVTLAVPSGWRNDSTWPWGLSLSRPDTPGATLQLLNDAHDVRITRCSADAVGGPHSAARLVTLLTRVAGLANGGPAISRIGERRGYTIDLNAGPDAHGVACPDGLVGTPLLASPPDDFGNAWALALRAGESARIVVANGSRGRTLALVGTVRGGEAALKAWMAKAQPVIDSITFAPCTFSHIAFRPCEDLGTTSP